MRTLVALVLYVSPAIAANGDLPPFQLALKYRLAGDYLKAEALLRDPSCDRTAPVLNTLADILREEGRSAESRRLFAEALALPTATWINRTDSLEGLAEIDRDPALWRRAIELARAHNDRAVEAVGLRGLGVTWLEQGNPARAEPLLMRALAIFEMDTELHNHQTAATLSFLAEIYVGDNKPALAEDALLRALSIDERVLGLNHPQVAILLQILADAVSRLDRIDQARLYLDRAVQIMSTRFGEDSAIAGSVYANRGIIEQRADHNAEAAAVYRKALLLLDKAGPELAAVRSAVISRYAQTLKATHRNREAKTLLAQLKAFVPGDSGHTNSQNMK